MRFLALFREFSDNFGIQKIAIFRGSAKNVFFVKKLVPLDPWDPLPAGTFLALGAGQLGNRGGSDPPSSENFSQNHPGGGF